MLFQPVLLVLLYIAGVMATGKNPGSSPVPNPWDCPPYGDDDQPLIEQPSNTVIGNGAVLCVYQALGACFYDYTTGAYTPALGQIIGNADSKDDCPDQLNSSNITRRRAIKTRQPVPVAPPRAGARAAIPNNLKKRSELRRARK